MTPDWVKSHRRCNMLKKSFQIVFAVLLAFSCTCSVSVYATNKSEIAPLSATTSSRTVSDSAGNKFFVLGVSYRATDKCRSTTSFETTFYSEGTVSAKKNLDAKSKTLGAGGTVTMYNFASTQYSGAAGRTGAAGSYTRYSDQLLYYPISVSGTHSFSCNGASWRGDSSDNLLF